jgi:uncharacterized integral membrane protein
MRLFKVIFASLLTILGIVFIVENLETLKLPVRLKLDLYVLNFQSPDVHLWVLILFTFFLGVFTASLYGIYEILQQRQTIRKLQHNLELLAQEVRGGSPEGPEPGAATH